MTGEHDAVAEDLGGRKGRRVRRLDHALHRDKRHAVALREIARVVVAVDPSDDVRVTVNRGEDLGGVPKVVLVVGKNGMMGEDDNTLTRGARFGARAVKPCELRGAERSVPRLGLAQPGCAPYGQDLPSAG